MGPARRTALAILCGSFAWAGCSTDGARAPSADTPSRRVAAPAAGSYAFAQQDLPFEQVLAQSRTSGRPVLLYYWASW